MIATRWWWVRHAPVASGGRIYGQDDLPADCSDGAAHRFWHAPALERPPGGESFAEVVERVGGAIERISAANGGRDNIVVAHGGSIRAALAHALGLAAEKALGFAVDNCSLTRLDHFAADDAWRVGAVNLSGFPGPRLPSATPSS